MASSGNPKPSGTNYRESAQFQSAVAMADEMQREDKMRNELFAGKYESAPAPQEEMTVDQLVKKAENTHTETTQAAQRALRVRIRARAGSIRSAVVWRSARPSGALQPA